MKMSVQFALPHALFQATGREIFAHGFAKSLVESVEGEEACKQQQPACGNQAVEKQDSTNGLRALLDGLRVVTEV